MNSSSHSSGSYSVCSFWGPRPETYEQVASRFRRFIDVLSNISPFYSKWELGGEEKAQLFEDVRDELGELILRKTLANKYMKPELDGYCVGGFIRAKSENHQMMLWGSAGGRLPAPWYNSIILSTPLAQVPDLATIEYPIFKAIMMAAIDSWEPLVCAARSHALIRHYQQEGPFNEAWMLYVPPHLASSVQPPDIPVVEHMPNGGLFLAATTDIFNVNNLAHFRAARLIARATMHLNPRK